MPKMVTKFEEKQGHELGVKRMHKKKKPLEKDPWPD
jgi:hypothetical protein